MQPLRSHTGAARQWSQSPANHLCLPFGGSRLLLLRVVSDYSPENAETTWMNCQHLSQRPSQLARPYLRTMSDRLKKQLTTRSSGLHPWLICWVERFVANSHTYYYFIFFFVVVFFFPPSPSTPPSIAIFCCCLLHLSLGWLDDIVVASAARIPLSPLVMDGLPLSWEFFPLCNPQLARSKH